MPATGSLRARKGEARAEIVSLRSFVEDGGARLNRLLSELGAHVAAPFRFPKIHPAEVSQELLETLGVERGRCGHPHLLGYWSAELSE